MHSAVHETVQPVNLAQLVERANQDAHFESIAASALRNVGRAVVGPSSLRPLVAAQLALSEPGPLLVVTPTGREAEELTAMLGSGLPECETRFFPSWETLPHERLSPSAETVGRRLHVLRELRTNPELRVVVTPIRALLQPIIASIGDVAPIEAVTGADLSHDELVARLIELGYERAELVEKRGQLAVRGGIIDVFAPTEEHPVRIEFWGDNVEEIRQFSVADQRSMGEALDRITMLPVSELLITNEVRDRAATLAAEHPELADIASKIAQGQRVQGMEALASVLTGDMSTLLDAFTRPSAVLLVDPERIRTRAEDLVRTSEEFLEASWHNAAAGNVSPIDLGASAYRSLAELRDGAPDLAWWELTPFGLGDDLELRTEELPDFGGNIEQALTYLRDKASKGWDVSVVAEGQGSAQRLIEELSDQSVSVVTGVLTDSFALTNAKLMVVSEGWAYGRKAVRVDTRLPSRRRTTIDPLALTPGDYVVHEQHGVGKYIEMAQRSVAGAMREYLVLEYASSKRGQPPDRLYVPMDQLDQITRYVGGEQPTVHRLGGADWAKAKGRARKAVREIANELVKLYAARMSSKGHAFGPDTPWQGELEDAFAYVETPDQLECINEVKADMQRAVPMDRVVCGDVGYGKTEIAVRAAFKAVQDGKQVAILVPTTLLVQQHYSTFSSRYAPFPIKVAALSRFNTDAEAKKVIEELESGVVDVVIGTHRLLTPGIRFKDLGLVIVDEEQRFGVEHKEHLKAIRTNVDVLAMSATPIPRTLEMAVTGIREMSVIATPPEERHPVLTYVGPYDDKQISAAIGRELMRDGQVFFVHNRVESIDKTAARIADMVPNARVAVAHGQMNEHELERVILDFWENQIDVLVCTTIIETGIDIPNANTLIVDRADRFGLSQLHQLRGRVGRSRERGYAYFLYPAEKPLTETAHERLATVAQHTDLGSGMQIALKDLEIRGAGNLLGGEQSGHIADVGFDLYIRLVGEALAEVKGDAATEEIDVKVELPLDAHIPHEYIETERLRLEAYKRLAAATTDEQVDGVIAELTDRYGTPPIPVLTLAAVAKLRVLAKGAGLHEIVASGTAIRFAPVELAESATMRLTRLYPGTIVKAAVRTILVPRPRELAGTALLDWTTELITNAIAPS